LRIPQLGSLRFGSNTIDAEASIQGLSVALKTRKASIYFFIHH